MRQKFTSSFSLSLLRLHQPVHRQHGGSGACRQPAADVPRLGRRGPVLLSADRVLLHRSEEWRSGNESVRRDPCG